MTGRTLALSAAAALLATWACGCRPAKPTGGAPDAARRRAIADTLTRRVAAAYDFSAGGDVVGRLMSLYPDSGPVISAAAGRVTTTRAALERNVRQFWDYVGQNMRDARWEWVETRVDVLSPESAVLTATYRVPHRTPRGDHHTIGGAWTAVFERRGGRWVVVHEHLSDAPEEFARDSTAAEHRH